MNHFISGIIKITILEASIALLLIERALSTVAGEPFARARRWGFWIIAALSVFAFTNYGNLRGNFSMVHQWEQFHFYLGAKYQSEVGWFDLYKAVLLADRESTGILRNLTETRDITNFEVVSIAKALEDGPRVRANFTDERWAEFKADWAELAKTQANWRHIILDHGNSNSPAWAILAHPIASILPINRVSQTLIGLLDAALMVFLWWFAYRTFGDKAAGVGLVIFSSLPIVFDYLAGSFLRWDWLFAVGMAMCFLKRERYATAGAFFGYAVATKLFPLFFGVALLFRAAYEAYRTRSIPRRYLRFGVSAFASLAAAVILSSAMFGTPRVWLDYKKRIDVARVEKYYPIQYSLRTVYLQMAETPVGEYFRTLFFPREIQQARADVNLADHRVGFLVVQLLLTAAVVFAVLRADDVSAFSMGPILVFIWLMVNMYYWNMLGLLALGLMLRKGRPPLFALIGLHVIFAVYYLYQHTNHRHSEAYVVALLLFVWTLVFGATEAIGVFRARSLFPAPALPGDAAAKE
jgi:hypothetical protein